VRVVLWFVIWWWPGGYGTLDEVFEVLNLRRTRRLNPFPVTPLGSRYWLGLRDAGLCRNLGIADDGLG
jgi:predicted Rossmann-fold nucleotide-binding protein